MMKRIIYKGKYDGDESKLPSHPHEKNAVMFHEAKDSKELAKIMNVLSFTVFFAFTAFLFWRLGRDAFSFWSILLFFATIVPHELIHALCFREEVYLYQNLKEGMLFVTGTEVFSKYHFILMSLMPCLVLGIVPFALCMIFPGLHVFGMFSVLCLASCAGDYYNAYNAFCQIPKNGKVYMHGFHSYWFLSEADSNTNDEIGTDRWEK